MFSDKSEKYKLMSLGLLKKVEDILHILVSKDNVLKLILAKESPTQSLIFILLIVNILTSFSYFVTNFLFLS